MCVKFYLLTGIFCTAHRRHHYFSVSGCLRHVGCRHWSIPHSGNWKEKETRVDVVGSWIAHTAQPLLQIVTFHNSLNKYIKPAKELCTLCTSSRLSWLYCVDKISYHIVCKFHPLHPRTHTVSILLKGRKEQER